MPDKKLVRVFVALAAFSAIGSAQTAAQIDRYFGDWRSSEPRLTHGALEEHDIFTKGDWMNPPRKGAVLRYLNSYSYATLPAKKSTTPTKLQGEQEIAYVASGRGIASGGGDQVDLHAGVAILLPEKLEFTLTSSGPEPLTMYLVREPVAAGFQPKTKIVAKDENVLPVTSSSEFWDRIVKPIFVAADGLSTLQSFSTVTLDPLTITQPELVQKGTVEEVWTGLSGSSIVFIGTQLRRQGPGIAHLYPPDHQTPLSELNYSEEQQIKLLYFVHKSGGASE